MAWDLVTGKARGEQVEQEGKTVAYVYLRLRHLKTLDVQYRKVEVLVCGILHTANRVSPLQAAELF